MVARGRRTSSVEFPILVYRDGDDWVAQSIWTCTTAVAKSDLAALEEACRLLSAELEAALEDAKGNVDEALRSITCPAPEHILRLYYSKGGPIDPPRSVRPRLSAPTAPEVPFTPREVALA
jgi:hypothetical protein